MLSYIPLKNTNALWNMLTVYDNRFRPYGLGVPKGTSVFEF